MKCRCIVGKGEANLQRRLADEVTHVLRMYVDVLWVKSKEVDANRCRFLYIYTCYHMCVG